MNGQSEASRKKVSPAVDVISAGAVAAGNALGLRARGEKPRPELEVEPTPAPPDLGLLLFVDEEEEKRPSYGYSWESVQPPSFAEWAYRCTPRSKARLKASRELSITSTTGPSIDLTTISESTQAHDAPAQCKRAATATPSSTEGSTRVPSRASPEEFPPHALLRPPSRQRAKAGPRRPRSSMGISDVKRSPDSNPRRPQTSMGICHSSGIDVHPLDANQNRPRSSLGFSHGGSSEPMPARPKSSMGVCTDVRDTEYVTADLRCGFSQEEGSSEHTRTASIHAGFNEVGISALEPTRSRAEQLDAAAAEAGAKARGDITLAIRARTICRRAGNAASRKLLHLWGDWDCPPDWMLEGKNDGQSKDTVAYPSSRDATDTEGNKNKTSPDGLSSIGGRHNVSPLIFDDNAPRKRSIKVAENTALGRMVLADPERAAKYDLVTIPAWQLNTSWPPPPIGTRQLIQQAAFHSRAKAFEMEAEKIARLERAESRKALMHKRVAKMKVVASLVGLRYRTSQEINSTKTMDSTVSEQVNVAVADDDMRYSSEVADLESAATILDWSQREAYRAIFNRFAKHDDYKLSRRNMIRAMREAGLTPTCKDEQRRFSAVQEQVMEFTRGEYDEKPYNNPLTNQHGRWELEEFLLVCAALREINLRQIRVSNKEVADEFNVPMQEVDELRNVFHRYDPENSGTISGQDLKELLMAVDMKTTDEDFNMLLRSAGLQKVERFEFKEFMRLLTSLETVMKSPVKVVGSQGSQSERKASRSPIKSSRTSEILQSKSPGAVTPKSRGFARMSTKLRPTPE